MHIHNVVIVCVHRRLDHVQHNLFIHTSVFQFSVAESWTAHKSCCSTVLSPHITHAAHTQMHIITKCDPFVSVRILPRDNIRVYRCRNAQQREKKSENFEIYCRQPTCYDTIKRIIISFVSSTGHRCPLLISPAMDVRRAFAGIACLVLSELII